MSDQNSNQEFWEYADNLLDNKRFLNKIKSVSSDEEMIKAVKSFFKWSPSDFLDNKLLSIIINNKFKKSSAESMKYAEEAIKAANNGEKGRSLKLANMITAFAEDAGDLALGHLIRFQLLKLFNINFYDQIEELELCVKSPEPPKKINDNIKLKQSNGQRVSPNLKKKELTQALKYLQAESNSPGVKKYYDDKEQQKNNETKFYRDIFTLKSPNPMAPALEDFVQIKYDTVKGRHLIVTKDVPVGTNLLFERPFAAALSDVFELEISHCHHCFKTELVPIPCPYCVFVLYCSEKCLEESKEYHQNYECFAFPHLHSVLSSVKVPCSYICAYTTICTFGPQQLFRYFQKEQQQVESTSKEKESEDFVIPGFDPGTGIYESSSFHTIIQMFRTKIPLPCCDAFIMLAMAKILETRTDFFQQLESELELKSPKLKYQFQDFIILSLYKLSKSYVVGPSIESKYIDDPDEVSLTWACSTQPTGNLKSHACDANFTCLVTMDLKEFGVAGVALRDLKKGEEVAMCYRSNFTQKPRAERQMELSTSFHFKCDCVACLNDWPLMEELEAEKDSPKFCCPLCSFKIPPEPKMMTNENFDKIGLNSRNNFKCLQCKSEYKEKELMSQFKRNVMALNIAEKLIKAGSSLKTLESLKVASTFFQRHLIPPSFYQATCKEMLQQVFLESILD